MHMVTQNAACGSSTTIRCAMRPRELGRAGKLEALRDGLYRRRAGFAPGAGGPGRAAGPRRVAARGAEVGRGGRALSDSARAYLVC